MRIEELFSGTYKRKFRLADIADGDVIPFFNQHYLVDSANFHLEKIDEREDRINKQKVKKFLDDKKLDISVDDFIALWNFQTWVQMNYPDRNKNSGVRGDALYKMLGYGNEKPMPLSVAFEKKIVMCTEMSALAQMYLQRKGIKSVVYNGNAFDNPDKDIKFGGEPHAWLMITLNGKKYFYDPANPIFMDNMLLPAIMDYSKLSKADVHEFEEIIHKPIEQGGFAYLEAVDVYGAGRRWLYGFEGDFGHRIENAVKRQVPKASLSTQQSHTRNM